MPCVGRFRLPRRGLISDKCSNIWLYLLTDPTFCGEMKTIKATIFWCAYNKEMCFGHGKAMINESHESRQSNP